MRSKIVKRLLFGLSAVLFVGALLMLTPRAYGLLYPEKTPVGYHYLWSSYLAIAVGLEELIETKPAVPDDLESITDVTYKEIDGRPLQLDFYKSKDLTGPAPLLVFIHGGSWKKGNRADMLPLMIDFARHGYITATISYRLDGYPGCVIDVCDAMTWFLDHGTQYGYDTARMGIVGASAGAHLAMLAAYGWQYKKDGKSATDKRHHIKAVVDIFGPVDLTTDFARKSASAAWFIGEPYNDAADRYAEASPIVYVDEQAPPTMIIHGTSDELVPNSQADQLHHRLDSAGVPCVDDRYPLWPHAMILVQRVYDHCEPRMTKFLNDYLDPNDHEPNSHEPLVARD